MTQEEAEALFVRISQAVIAVQSGRQAQLEAQAALRRATDDLATAEAELAAARQAADEEIEIAVGRRSRAERT
jgi:hypothetical protein